MRIDMKDELDFEIRFLEGVLKKCPHFTEVLVALAELYTQRGLFLKGLNIDKKLSLLKPKDEVVFYNLACSYSLVKKIDEALKTFKLAVKYGYSEFDHVLNDADLDNLWKDERFKNLMRKIRKKQKNYMQYCSE